VRPRHGGNAKTYPAGSAESRKWCAGWSAAAGQRKTKKQERLERAMELRAFALQLLGKYGRWTTLPPYGDEVLRFEDSRFLILFYVREQVPKDFRERFHLAPLAHGLYNLDLWNLQGEPRKVLNINWLTVGATPRIVTFRRGDWEQRLLRC
jgi:hypothetical protein